MTPVFDFFRNLSLNEEEEIKKDLACLTEDQAKFNKWFENDFHFHGNEKFLNPPVKISRVKCLGWRLLPETVLGCRRYHFKGWDIGHCLNCNADPYDCSALAWSYDGGIAGALLKCGKCGELRWQPKH